MKNILQIIYIYIDGKGKDGVSTITESQHHNYVEFDSEARIVSKL